MSQPEKRPKVKLDARVSPELKEKVRDYQQAHGMKEISEAIIDLIERALKPDVESLSFQKCAYRSEIPSRFGKFINCKKGTMNRALTITKEAQQCLACQLYAIIEVSSQKVAQIQAKIQQNEKRCRVSERLYQDLQNLIAEGNAKLEEISQTLNVAMNRPVESKPVSHGNLSSTEKPAIQKVEPNPQLIKRVVEEKKTTEEYLPSQDQKKRPDILCPKTQDYVSIDDACKKCDGIAECPQYGEYVYLRATKKQ